MSYDVSIQGSDDLDANYTYNVGGMIRAACESDGPNQWDGMVCRDLLPRLNTGIAAMISEPQKFDAMNPANGWGDRMGCVRFLQEIRDACERDPNGILAVG